MRELSDYIHRTTETYPDSLWIFDQVWSEWGMRRASCEAPLQKHEDQEANECWQACN